jgi:diaminopimelate epimerase
MRFEKWHALGNAYVLVVQPDAGPLTPDLVRRLCDAETGIGSDGVIEVLTHEEARAEIAIWNPDGSGAEMSGNGTRIAAAWPLRDVGGAGWFGRPSPTGASCGKSWATSWSGTTSSSSSPASVSP